MTMYKRSDHACLNEGDDIVLREVYIEQLQMLGVQRSSEQETTVVAVE